MKALLVLLSVLPFLLLPSAEGIKEQFSDSVKIPFNSTQILRPDGTQEFMWTSHPERIQDSFGQWQEYILTEDANSIKVETGQGSFQIDKLTCNFSFYNKGKITGFATIPSDTYLALQSADNIIWNEVTQLNNAACQTVVIESGNDIEVQTIKTHAVGEMKIRYIKNMGEQLKSQMEVTNTSGLNDRYFGFYQLLEVPQLINWGGNQIDLATKNNNFYDRDFIIANQDKLIRLSSKINYDFDKAFDNLNGVTVLWDGNKAVLQFDYTFNAKILLDGETFVIDPIYTGNPNYDTDIEDDDNDGNCEDVGSASYDNHPTFSTLFVRVAIVGHAGLEDCMRSVLNFDISSLPTTGATFANVSLVLEVGCCHVLDPAPISFYSITSIDVSTATAAAQFDAVDNDFFLGEHPGPSVAGSRNTFQFLDPTVNAHIATRVGATGNMTFGYKFTDETMNATRRIIQLLSSESSSPDPELIIHWYLGGPPDAVSDLVITNVAPTSLDLSWSTPFLNGTLDGYQINFTTPEGNPNTVITNNTFSGTTAFGVSGLVQLTDYSFRIGVWTNNTGNFTGNIANATTTTFGNFTVGFFDLNATNVDARDIKYNRIDVNDTIVDLEVTYPNFFNTSCNFHYMFAMKNDTFYNLASDPVPPGESKATFRFLDVNNEVINVICMDETTGVSAPYLITITDFPLLQQFQNFTSGVYGTEGQFGSIDLISLGAIIVMMVGFNRFNESVGAIFAVIILGILSYFDIVQWFSFMFGTFAVVIMLTIASTRKM